jgi:integrase
MPKAALYIRVVLSDGRHHYAKAVFLNNGHVKFHYALIGKEPEHHPEGTYYIRYKIDNRRIWEAAGTEPALATIALQRRNLALQGKALGLDVQPSTPAPTPTPLPKGELEPKPPTLPQPELLAPEHPLPSVIAEYLAEVKAGKSAKTHVAYTLTLKGFAESCTKPTLESVDRQDILAYKEILKTKGSSHLKAKKKATKNLQPRTKVSAHLKSKNNGKQKIMGNAPRTISNRLDFLKIFFNHYAVSWPLLKTDRVKYTEKEVSAYTTHEIQSLLSAANQEETDLIQFLLCTGVREQEAMYATWRDVDFNEKTFSIREKLDLGFTPKDKEEGIIPIPNFLVELLQARRNRSTRTRLIFPRSGGEAEGHLLRIIKGLAYRAGMNCGECYNRAGECCATSPTCTRFILHRFRKSFATMHHEAGVSAYTIKRWLRHSSLDTTLRYLAGSDDKSEKTRAQVNSTFAEFQGIKEGA